MVFLIRTKPVGDPVGDFELCFIYRYGERAVLTEGGPVFRWRVLDEADRNAYEYQGCIELPDGRRVALIEEGPLSLGSRWRSEATVTDDDGVTWALPKLANPSQLGAWRKGVKAALFGPEGNPYGDARTWYGGVTYARAFSKRWDEGYARGQELKAALRAVE